MNSVGAFTFNRYFDSSRNFIKFNNTLLINPAFTGFNNHFTLYTGLGCYTPDIPVENDWSKPKEYINSTEFSFGKLVSFSLGLSSRINEEAAMYKKEINVAFSISRQTLKFGNFRIGISGSSIKYENDWSKLTFGDQINFRLGFLYPTNEPVPANGVIGFDFVTFNAGFFYSYKNIFYAGYSKLFINEPVFSLYGNEYHSWYKESQLHSKEIVSAGGRININKDFEVNVSALIQNTKYYEITQIQPSLGVGYKSKYYLGGGINLINSDFTTYYFQLNADVFRCVEIAFKYELLTKNYFSNALSPVYWGISTSFYIDRFLKQK
jgi:hypothetical protein